MPNDTAAEATSIFVRAHHETGRGTGEYRETRQKAGQELLSAVRRSAEQAGLTVREEKIGHLKGYTLIGLGNSTSAVLCEDATTGVECFELQDAQIGKKHPMVGLEFDPTSKRWIGKDVDANIAPTPGAPLRRRNPVTVVAEAVAKIIGRS